jgi:PQQ-dependent dehydrogenase (methanol/ethanol family)
MNGRGWIAALGIFVASSATAETPTPPLSAAPPDDGQWTVQAKNYASTRYTDLAEITTDNVKNLKVAFTFSTGVTRGHEAAPLVVGSTIYIVAPFPNILYALDLSKPGAPMKWKYEPNPESAAQGVACCDVINRGATYWNGRIYYNTLDDQTVAVDAETGKEAWKVKVGDIRIGETITMAPLVVKGKVLVGNSGGEYGVRGWLTALDADTGKLAWKAYSTGPDKDVLIGPDFHAFYDSDKGTDLGVSTWPPQAWQQGGGNVWGWISYDPDLDLVYYGTGNPGPWNADLRPGDNKWTAGIFARDPDDGSAKWFYQWSPHDVYDHDGINEQILLDMVWEGQSRKVLVRPERNGFLYILDRTTGEVLSAKPYGNVNSITGIDLKTGRPTMNPAKNPRAGIVVRDICPNASGEKDWNPSAYSPKTGLLYIPHTNLCQDIEFTTPNYISGTPYIGAEIVMKAGPGGNPGVFTAWDVQAGKAAWEVKEQFPLWSGAAVTAGNVVFYGTLDGWFKAVDARDGTLLWQFKCASGIVGQPSVYRGPDGHEYVAILSGVGGWVGGIVAGDLDRRDTSAALGFVAATQALPDVTTKGGVLYVFAL